MPNLTNTNMLKNKHKSGNNIIEGAYANSYDLVSRSNNLLKYQII